MIFHSKKENATPRSAPSKSVQDFKWKCGLGGAMELELCIRSFLHLHKVEFVKFVLETIEKAIQSLIHQND
jgi:hypothetical protein